MNDNPVLLVLMIAAGIYVFSLWRQDYLAASAGHQNSRPLPGATPTTVAACLIAVSGVLVILGLETWGEIWLGLSEEQSKITVFFGIYTLVAAFIEELIFRGFVVIEGKSKALRWFGIIGASVVFAALHPFLWSWDDEFAWTFTEKGWFSTAAVFVSSLWFYTVRFGAFNPSRSLIPCVVAHAAKNIGVFAIKGIQGFVIGWW